MNSRSLKKRVLLKKKILLLALAANHLNLLSQRNKSKIRRWRIRPLNQHQRKYGRFLNTFTTMKNNDPEEFYKYTRLHIDEFNNLAGWLKNKLEKRSCINTITTEERLAITLSYLAQGSAMCEVARSYLRGRSTVSLIIKETCNAIWDVLMPKFMLPPTLKDWKKIMEIFNERWNMPNCLGAVDGKHIQIQSPFKSGTSYYNYKHCYSIHLMAICDADYRFIFVDIGAQGICGDSGVFRKSSFGSAIIDETLNVPRTAVLPRTNIEFPCFFVADEAFPLRRNIMRPYSHKNASRYQRIYNYRLSRARRIIENTFGILASRWRILRRPIIAHPKTVDSIVKATTVLHNYLKSVRNNDNFIHDIVDREIDGQIIPGKWRNESNGFCHLISQGSRNYSRQVMELRDSLCSYLSSENGSVPWQNDII